MGDDTDADGTGPWFQTSADQLGAASGEPQIEVIPDAYADTVTFAERIDPDRDTTAAWITVERSLVQDASEFQ